MDFVVSKRELLRLIGRCESIADKKSTMPVLGNTLLNASSAGVLQISATNLYLSLTGTTRAAVKQAGSISIGAKDLLERVKYMPEGEIQIATKDGATTTLRAVGSARRYTLSGIPGEDFPELPKPAADAEELTIEVETLATLITSTHFSISPDDSRLHLNSALLEWDGSVIRMVTTDGHRLTKAEIDRPGTDRHESMLIPLKGITELRRLCEEARSEKISELKIVRSGQNAFFSYGEIQFSVKLVDAQFPPYGQVIPKSTSYQVKVARAKLIDALRAVSVAANNRTLGVKLTLTSGAIHFISENPESGEGFDEIPVDYSGPGLSIGFNYRYLLDAVSAVDSAEVELGFSGELDPTILTCPDPLEGHSYLAVIMPMKI